MKRREFAALVPLLGSVRLARAGEGGELLGKAAPPLGLKDWLNSPPLEIAELRGKVVLLRWWTDGCPYCAATAPALNSLEHEYGARGLVIIGVYHPKPPGKWTIDGVRRATAEKKFTFPVAIDGDWSALKSWWLTRERGFTSVSFLLDQNGTIRYIHRGGEFHEGSQGGTATHATCNGDMHFIREEIGRLLNV